MDNFVQRVRDIRIGEKYQLLRKLGSGSFGQVYLGRDVGTGEEVAIKLEHHFVEESLLEEEAGIYPCLAGQHGFPQVYWYGDIHDFTVLVFELLGPNLEDLFRYCGNQFSLKTTLMLADQLLCRFEVLHSHDYLHRDVKPENLLLGLGRRGNMVYITDLGLAIYHHPERWSSSSSPARDVSARPPQLLGTCRYASINGHLGVGKHSGNDVQACSKTWLTLFPAQSRRDDLEALGYMLIYFMRGKLPWQGLKTPSSEARYLRVLEMKQTTSVSELCADLPTEFADYMNYVHNLRYEDRPDYRFLRKMFRNLFCRQGFEYDNVFDWTILEFQRLEAESEPRQPLARDVVGEGRGGDVASQSERVGRDATKKTRRRSRH